MKNASNYEDHKIIITLADRPRHDLPSLKDRRWVFLGTDPLIKEKLLTEFGDIGRYYFAAELQAMASSNRQSFLDWISEMGQKYENPMWWASNIAYKIPVTTDLFLNYCYVLLIRYWVANRQDNLLIVLESRWLLQACIANFSPRDVLVLESSAESLAARSIRRVILSAKLWLCLTRAILLWLTDKVMSNVYFDAASIIPKSTLDVIICTWIEKRSFEHEGKAFYDPYLGVLNDLLEQKRFAVAALSLPVISVRLLRKSYASKVVLPAIHLLGFLDMYESYRQLNQLHNSVKVPSCAGFNLEALVRYELFHGWQTAYNALLHYRAVYNLFGKRNLQCKVLLYPFENQPWDKMMTMACRKAKAVCKIIGCHTFSLPPFYLNFYFGKHEANIHPQPDVIVSNGGHWVRILRESGFTCRIENGGSLRYASTTKTEIRTSQNLDGRERTVLVLLSNSLSYSLDLLFYLIKKNDVEKTFLVKPHPDTPERIIRKYVKNFPMNFRFVEGTMEKCMTQAGWAIHVGTTAALECMMNGIKVLKYLPERIDLDPLLGIDTQQDVVTDEIKPDFKNRAHPVGLPDSSLIGEPFNRELWERLLQ